MVKNISRQIGLFYSVWSRKYYTFLILTQEIILIEEKAMSHSAIKVQLYDLYVIRLYTVMHI